MRELYQTWPTSLTNAQIDAINVAAFSQPEHDATIFASPDKMAEIRVSTIRWLSDPWISDLLWTYVRRANEDGFAVDVDNDAEMQFTEYPADQGGHYDWHQDVNWNGQIDIDRKISITVQLSNENEYDGGNFEFDELETNTNFKLKGTIIIFPSYLRHRVTPVTSGVRKSLVAWFSGPQWR